MAGMWTPPANCKCGHRYHYGIRCGRPPFGCPCYEYEAAEDEHTSPNLLSDYYQRTSRG